MIDREYLEFVGFEKVSPYEVKLKDLGYNKIPTLSCKLGNDGETFVFVLSFYPDVDSYKFQKQFTFDQVNDIINSIGDDEGELFHYFSLTDSLLSKVRSARFSGGGRKPWKKRNWPLPIKWSKVKQLFQVEHFIDDERIADCIANMNVCVRKAAESFSYQPFELYYSSYNELLRLQGKKGRGSRKIAWSQFKCVVERLQNCSFHTEYEENEYCVDKEDFDE